MIRRCQISCIFPTSALSESGMRVGMLKFPLSRFASPPIFNFQFEKCFRYGKFFSCLILNYSVLINSDKEKAYLIFPIQINLFNIILVYAVDFDKIVNKNTAKSFLKTFYHVGKAFRRYKMDFSCLRNFYLGLAKIILPAAVWSAEVTSTEIVRLK